MPKLVKIERFHVHEFIYCFDNLFFELFYKTFRLHERGAAEMVLQVISASNDRLCEMVVASLDLGIALLQGTSKYQILYSKSLSLIIK